QYRNWAPKKCRVDASGVRSAGRCATVNAPRFEGKLRKRSALARRSRLDDPCGRQACDKKHAKRSARLLTQSVSPGCVHRAWQEAPPKRGMKTESAHRVART